MSKITKRVRHADASFDHRHRLPDGSFTGGMLNKPNKDQSEMHSHLYENCEDTAETAPMHNFGDHTHSSQFGESSGPMPMQKEPGEPWQKMDSIEREGRMFILRNSAGRVIARGPTAAKVVEHCDSYDADETMAKASFSHAIQEDVDEGKWEEAKKASISSVGHIKWPLVQYIYQNMGGT